MRIQCMLAIMLFATDVCLATETNSFVVESKDVASVKVAFSRSYPPVLEIRLWRTKARELADFTAANLMKKVTIIVQNEKLSEPVVRKAVTNGVLEVSVSDAEKATSLAKELMKKEDKTPNKASDAIGAETAPQHQR